MQIIVIPVCTKHIPYPHSAPVLLTVHLAGNHFSVIMSLMDAIQNKKIQTFTQNKYVYLHTAQISLHLRFLARL